MRKRDAEEFTQAMAQMVAGTWRQIAWAERMGIPKALGMTLQEWVRTRFGGYTRLSVEDRREAVEELADDGMSNREISDVLGVDEKTVRRDRETSAANAASQESPEINDIAEKDAEISAANAAPSSIQSAADRKLTKAEKRAAREAELAAKQAALPDKRYGVILADPEWRFEPYSRETGMDRAADNHYPTSNVHDIAARPVQNIAADDCALFLWATVPMLQDALWVMHQWGFEYKSHLVWDKVHIGTGYWVRNKHELLLIGTRGDIPAPAPGEQFPSLINGVARGEHSAKPVQFIEMIEHYFPHLPKIELNRRGPPRPGWDAWGLEAEQPAEAAA